VRHKAARRASRRFLRALACRCGDEWYEPGRVFYHHDFAARLPVCRIAARSASAVCLSSAIPRVLAWSTLRGVLQDDGEIGVKPCSAAQCTVESWIGRRTSRMPIKRVNFMPEENQVFPAPRSSSGYAGRSIYPNFPPKRDTLPPLDSGFAYRDSQMISIILAR
jgi:hypothetical protein